MRKLHGTCITWSAATLLTTMRGLRDARLSTADPSTWCEYKFGKHQLILEFVGKPVVQTTHQYVQLDAAKSWQS
jgi:hypothetical protein